MGVWGPHRPSARARGYDSAWDKARAGYLRSHPLCRMCAEEGQRIAATHVDHITPHRGDQTLFWDKTNWQGLCTTHHNRDKQQIETRGYRTAVGDDGLPIDQRHPFYAK